MGVIAIIVNCALIGVSGQVQRIIPGASREMVIIIIVLLEVNLFIYFVLSLGMKCTYTGRVYF